MLPSLISGIAFASLKQKDRECKILCPFLVYGVWIFPPINVLTFSDFRCIITKKHGGAYGEIQKASAQADEEKQFHNSFHGFAFGVGWRNCLDDLYEIKNPDEPIRRHQTKGI